MLPDGIAIFLPPTPATYATKATVLTMPPNKVAIVAIVAGPDAQRICVPYPDDDLDTLFLLPSSRPGLWTETDTNRRIRGKGDMNR